MTSNGREVELKLEVEQASIDPLRSSGQLAGRPSEARRQQSVYFDTPSGKLRRNGFTLRVRDTGDGFVQTVKRADGGAGLFDREEWEAPVARFQPDRAALSETPLAALLKSRDIAGLVELFDCQVERTIWRIEDPNGALELSLDIGELRAGEQREPIAELEIELKAGSPDSVFRLARELNHRAALRIGVLSKAERGFAALDGALHKVTKAHTIALDPALPVAEGFSAIVRACLRHFRLNEPLVVAHRDAGALHQSRVAMRRLRAAFSLFRPAVRDERFAGIREELRWFTGQLGEARNLDVFLQNHPDSPQLDHFRERREASYSAVIEVLESHRFRDLMLALVEWAETGNWRSSKRAAAPLQPFAVRRIDKLWAEVSAGEQGLAAMDEESRHRLRIAIKKLRYALEFTASLHGSEATRRKAFAAQIERLQELLGFLNDMATARQLRGETGADEAAVSEAQAAHLKDAAKAFRKLRKASGYWRS